MIPPTAIPRLRARLEELARDLAPHGVEEVRLFPADGAPPSTEGTHDRALSGGLLVRVRMGADAAEIDGVLDRAERGVAAFAQECLAADLAMWDEAGFLRPAAFAEAFDREVRRAKRYNNILSYLVVETASDESTRATASSLLHEILRESDIRGVLGAGRYGILLIGADGEAADRAFDRIAAAAAKRSLTFSAQRSVFPFDGLDRAALEASLAEFA